MWPEGSLDESSTAACESRSSSFSRRFEALGDLRGALVAQFGEPLEVLLEPVENDRQIHRGITMTSHLLLVKHQVVSIPRHAPAEVVSDG